VKDQKNDVLDINKISNVWSGGPHYAEGLDNPKRLLILDTPKHVDSENIKLKIDYRRIKLAKIGKN
jgi:hypothetical protein